MAGRKPLDPGKQHQDMPFFHQTPMSSLKLASMEPASISQFTILRTSKQIRLKPDKSIRGHNFDGNNMEEKTSPICCLVQCSLIALNSMFCGLMRSGRLLTQIQMSRMTYIRKQFRRLRSIHFNMTKR